MKTKQPEVFLQLVWLGSGRCTCGAGVPGVTTTTRGLQAWVDVDSTRVGWLISGLSLNTGFSFPGADVAFLSTDFQSAEERKTKTRTSEQKNPPSVHHVVPLPAEHQAYNQQDDHQETEGNCTRHSRRRILTCREKKIHICDFNHFTRPSTGLHVRMNQIREDQ